MIAVGLKNWISRHRAVEPLPEADSTDEVLKTLEKELEIARRLAIVLADRAKRADVKVKPSSPECNHPGAKSV